ncbi:hypothetical protein HDU85_006614 [Gaertneriomyces sp. JEL0708]|nr:hypothetical protein HDU85_006614 [Gaertneriomyces sp. JEL0708]
MAPPNSETTKPLADLDEMKVSIPADANSVGVMPSALASSTEPPKPTTVDVEVKGSEYALTINDSEEPVRIEDVEKGAVPPAKNVGYVAHPLNRGQFILVFCALAMALFLAALDQTIVSTATTRIAMEFGAFQQVAWIGTAFMLSTTACTPTYGKLADIFGRKPTFLSALAIFLIGSALCGAAQSMTMLIIGRAIAGVGGGGIFAMILIIVTDLVSFRDRGKYQGIFGAIFGVSSVVGPLIGGAFTDGVGWRWCFWINLPLGALVVTVIYFVLDIPSPKAPLREKFGRIDYLGTPLLIIGTSLILTPLQLGGSDWDWDAPQTIALFIVGAATIIAFIYVERNIAKEPVIPGGVFENWSVILIQLIAFCLGANFFAMVYFISIYFQVVAGASATEAGIKCIPLILSVSLFSIAGGQSMSRLGRYKFTFFIGSVLLTVGCGMISTLDEGSNQGMRIGYLVLAGAGIGTMIQARIIGVQASVSLSNIAVATALVNFSQQLGGVIGLAVVGTTFNNVLSDKLSDYAPSKSFEEVNREMELVHTYPEPLRTDVMRAVVESLSIAFKVLIPLAGSIFLIALGVKEYRESFSRKRILLKDEVGEDTIRDTTKGTEAKVV